MRWFTRRGLVAVFPWLVILGALGLFAFLSTARGQAAINAVRPTFVWIGQQVGVSASPMAWKPNVREPTAEELQSVDDLEVPVRAPFRVSSNYGWRKHPVYGSRKFHNGIDLAVPVGTPVHAPQAGTVTKVSHDRRSGNYLTIDHGRGVETTYCHLDSVDVAKGAKVDLGDVVAKSGNTGATTGPHLHWIVKVNDRSMDPARLVSATASAE